MPTFKELLSNANDELNDEFNEKSEEWQDSDKGQSYSEWLQEISDAATVIEEAVLQLEEIEIKPGE
jgi:hypothetical protein